MDNLYCFSFICGDSRVDPHFLNFLVVCLVCVSLPLLHFHRHWGSQVKGVRVGLGSSVGLGNRLQCPSILECSGVPSLFPRSALGRLSALPDCLRLLIVYHVCCVTCSARVPNLCPPPLTKGGRFSAPSELSRGGVWETLCMLLGVGNE